MEKFEQKLHEEFSSIYVYAHVREYKRETVLTDIEKELQLLPGEKLERKTIMMQVDLEVAEKLENII